MTYRCKHFEIRELVPELFWRKHGERSWLALDDRALITLDALRQRYGKAVVNNYMFGGNFHQRGLRTMESEHYNPLSQHSYGRAFDVSFFTIDAEAVRQDIYKNLHLFPHIKGIEEGVTWLHFDTRNAASLVRFKP